MTERGLRGIVVSVGVGVGPAFVLGEPVVARVERGEQAAVGALARVAAELGNHGRAAQGGGS